MALLDAGRRGILDASADTRPLTMVHFDNGAKNRMCREFFDHRVARGLEFDAKCVPSAWENAALFDFGGAMVPSMEAFTGRE